jgi:lipopolysaccharide transport system permease protein
MTGVVEGFRGCLLGTEVCWPAVGVSVVAAVVLVLSGALFFRRMERTFVDVL